MRTGRALALDARVLVLAAWIAGLALRLYAGRELPRTLYGDEPWYAGTAEALVSGVNPDPAHAPYIRPPGTTWWIAAVFAVAGNGNLGAAGLANAIALSLGIPLIAAIGRRVVPGAGWIAPALAWAQAMNPFDFVHAGLITSEAITLPLVLAFALLCLRAADRSAWTRLGGAAVCGAALLHVRADYAPVVLGAFAFAALVAVRQGNPRRRALAGMGAAAALTFALCIPWSLVVSADREEDRFLADHESNPWFAERRGWWTWLSTVSMRREAWLQAYWLGPASIPAGPLSPGAFTGDDEAREVAALLAAMEAGDGVARLRTPAVARHRESSCPSSQPCNSCTVGRRRIRTLGRDLGSGRPLIVAVVL